jgi:hypothetical protein
LGLYFFAVLSVLLVAFNVFTFLIAVPTGIHVYQPAALPEGCISSNQAINIALLNASQYIRENWRVITNIDAKFFDSAGITSGNPGWHVTVWFRERFPSFYTFRDSPGYEVYVRANDSQIVYQGIICYL